MVYPIVLYSNMRHAREDYNRFQDPSGKIPEDEPVFLLRGQDLLAPATLRCWANFAVNEKLYDIAFKVFKWADVMEDWQRNNSDKIKNPDL